MYRKRYGKMTFRAWLNAEMEQSGVGWMVMGGVLTALVFVVVQFLSGSPYRVMLELNVADLVPPVWLLILLRFLAFLTVGCALGLVLGTRICGCDTEKYKGGMLCLLLIAAELSWYPTLFVAGAVVISLLEAILALFFSVCTTVCFFRVSRFSGWILILHNVWLLYLLILTVRIFLRN